MSMCDSVRRFPDFQTTLSDSLVSNAMRGGRPPMNSESAFLPSSDYLSHPIPNFPWAPNMSQLCLSRPVIIPQEKIEGLRRGWRGAYAPVLQECEIDRDSFLEFLDFFNQSDMVYMRTILPYCLTINQCLTVITFSGSH